MTSSEFDRLNQGDPDRGLGVLVTKCSGELVFIPSAGLKEQIKGNPDSYDDFMSGMGIFDDGWQKTITKQEGIKFVYYKLPEPYNRI